MVTRRSRSRWAVAIVPFVLAAAALAGSVIAGQFRQPDPRTFQADLATGEIKRIADIASADGLAGRGVFMQTTDAGQFCLWDALSATSPQRGGGCNSADDPLGGSKISASLAYDGGPAAESVRDARLIGLTGVEVVAVEILMSDGTRRAVRLKETTIGTSDFRAFGYRFRRSDLRNGIGPVSVIALGSGGSELARQVTGFGG